MKLRLVACALVGMMMFATQSVAMPFLSVDLDGYNADSAETQGATQAGFQSWALVQDTIFGGNWSSNGLTGESQVFTTSEGDVTATLTAVGGTPLGRNRGGDGGGTPEALYQDIAFVTRNFDGFGQSFLKLELAGLTPGETYLFTGYAREPFNGDALSFQGWTDIAALGGLDGPGEWMNTNVGDMAVYQPTDQDPAGYKNPIPTLSRSPISGPAPAGLGDYAASFATTADGSGVVTVYTWSDPESYSGTQTATALNGFELGAIPEPAAVTLIALGICGGLSVRRRER